MARCFRRNSDCLGRRTVLAKWRGQPMVAYPSLPDRRKQRHDRLVFPDIPDCRDNVELLTTLPLRPMGLEAAQRPRLSPTLRSRNTIGTSQSFQASATTPKKKTAAQDVPCPVRPAPSLLTLPAPSPRQRIRPHLEVHHLGRVLLAAFNVERGAVAGVRPYPAA